MQSASVSVKELNTFSRPPAEAARTAGMRVLGTIQREQRELSSLINEGLEQAKNGKTKPMKESLKAIRGKIQ
ncbi:MAG: hypothetical protein LBT01_04240 [Spirochaetaceae bacterium]|jgi:hypothetical protein|nr:hypothetical protein [Spirochaetaceae bacterium]